MPIDNSDLKINSCLKPVESEVRNLLEMFEFFLTERQLGKSIDKLNESVRDMRILIGRIVIDHFLNLTMAEESKFCEMLASMLADRAETLPMDGDRDKEYFAYCIGEIITSFEYAKEIKEHLSDDHLLQKMMALDIPILRPFDYGLKGKLKVIPTQKKKSIRHFR